MQLISKYRPSNFDHSIFFVDGSLVYQIRKSIEKESSLTYLLVGESGCGKTTFARCMAREYVKDDNNIYEFNASDLRGIDTVRDVGEIAKFTGRRCFIFDECHMLTPPAQESLLKLIEQPKSLFIFCTTEPEKLKDTFRRRCFVAEIEPLREVQLKVIAKRVYRGEGVKVSNKVLDFLSSFANGNPGKLLKAISRVINVSDYYEIVALLDNEISLEKPDLVELCRLLIKDSVSSGTIEKKVSELKSAGITPVEIKKAVLGYMSNVWLKGGGKNKEKAELAMDCFEAYNMYDLGFPGVVLAISKILKS
jgi:DNA polymerase III gamma/tau subunit